ncbi:hypothetical protein [Desulfovibrio legallii]|jgi:hypothetical protein|uniref:Uncharacterized protein n=1 Tax=Desulfovibrio legallii TaxID=571438 RepID=A0A1G7HTB8_9BACT|nr:hypothetical protein [Desulfovibrio legallii]SDF03741.1 hypothetical protein SAMN05192586_10127 [Desulfovibrio legallii]
MSFAPFSHALEALCAACAADATLPAPQARLLGDGLEALRADSAGFVAVVDPQNPFYLEFARYMEQGCRLEEDGLALLECLSIFFRLRQTLEPSRTPAPAEQRVQAYFERSGLWNPEDGNLVSQWYWRRIPAMGNNSGPR